MKTFWVGIVLVGMFPLSHGLAETLFVPSKDHRTIQSAIDAASAGDVIVIAAGTYLPDITLDTLGKAITLRGAVDRRTGRPLTLIDGGGKMRVLQCITNERPNTVFENLQLQNGSVEGSGGGMACDNTNPTLRNCVFKSNSAYDTIGSTYGFQGYGGGLYCVGRCPVLIHCRFESNSALRSGGGAYGRQIDFSALDDPEVLNKVPLLGCTFANNSADGEDRPTDGPPVTFGQRQGGGGLCLSRCVYSDNPEPHSILDDCVFEGNLSPVGGGLLLDESLGGVHPLLTNCRFQENSSVVDVPRSGNGGGAIAMFKSRPTIRDCEFDGNEVIFIGETDGNEVGGGGALRTWFHSGTTSSEATLIDGCTFTNNRVLGGASGGAYFLDDGNDHDVPQITHCQFHGNTAIGGRGGALFIVSGAVPEFASCDFKDNSADSGGGVYNFHSSPAFDHCIWIGNSAVHAGGAICNSNSSPMLASCTLTDNWVIQDGGGIYNNQYSSCSLESCEVTHNRAMYGNGGGIYSELPFSGTSLSNTLVCGNSPEQIYGNWTDEGGNTVFEPSPDLNGDGWVNGADVGLLLVDWGKTGDCLPADLDCDGWVDGADFGMLLAAWGEYP